MLKGSIEDRLLELGGLIPAREGAFAPLRDEDIAEIEERFGQSMPTDYKHFVFRYGRSMFALLPKFNIDAERFYYVGVFYGNGPDEDCAYHIQSALGVYCDRMPSSFLPIGESAGGEGEICLGMKEMDYGKIFFWDRSGEWADEEEEYQRQGKKFPEKLKYQNVTCLANSFEQFLFDLTPGEE